MKKVITVAGAGLVAASLLSPYLIGAQTQQRFEQQIAYFGTNNANSLSLESYERGYLASQAALRLRAPPPPAPQGPAATSADQAAWQALSEALEGGILLSFDIRHGPLPGAGGPGLFRASATVDAAASPLLSYLGISDLPLSIELEMGLGGEGELRAMAAPVTFDLPVGSFAFGGMDSLTRLSSYGRFYETEGELHGFTLSFTEGREPGQVVLSSAHIEGSGDFSRPLIQDDYLVRMPSMEIRQGAGGAVRMEGLQLEGARLEAAPGKASYDSSFSLDSAMVPGMPAALTGLVARLSVLDLDAQALTDFNQAMNELNAADDPALLQARMPVLFGSLLTGEPQFHIRELAFQLGPTVDLSLQGSLARQAQPASGSGATPGAAMMADPLAMLGSLDVSLDLDFSRGLLDMLRGIYLGQQAAALSGLNVEERERMQTMQEAQFEVMLNQMLGAGYLLQNGTRYRVQASFQGGSLNLNGQPLPLPFF